MTDGVDAAVHHMQASPYQPMIDGMTIDAGIEELRPRDGAVLAACEPRDLFVNKATFSLPGHARVN